MDLLRKLLKNYNWRKEDKNTFLIYDKNRRVSYILNHSAFKIFKNIRRGKFLKKNFSNIKEKKETIEFINHLRILVTEDKKVREDFSFLKKPLEASLEITRRCNLNCIHCGILKRQEDISLDTAKRRIDVLYKQGFFRISVFGGEPLLHPNFEKIIEYITQKGITTHISTNGVLLNKKILKFFQEHKVALSISLDGTNKTFNFIRDGTDANLIWQKILLARKFDISLRVSTIIARQNCSDIISLNKRMKLLGIRHKVVPIVPQGKASLKILPSPIDYFKLFNKIHKPITNNMQVKYRECGAGIVFIYVSLNGDIYPCPFWQISAVYLGNIDKDNFDNIWYSDKYKKLKQIKIEECYNCKYFDDNLCSGTCKARSHYIYNSYPNLKPDYYCLKRMNKEIT